MLGDKPKRFSRFKCPVDGRVVNLGVYNDGRAFTDCYKYECGMCPPPDADDSVDYTRCCLIRKEIQVTKR